MIAFVFAIGLALLALLFDLRTGRIPNALTFGGFAAGVILSDEPLLALVGACMCLAAALLIPSRRWDIGGGDIKLFFALGACVGPRYGLELEAIAALLFVGTALVRPRISQPLTPAIVLGTAAVTLWRFLEC